MSTILKENLHKHVELFAGVTEHRLVQPNSETLAFLVANDELRRISKDIANSLLSAFEPCSVTVELAPDPDDGEEQLHFIVNKAGEGRELRSRLREFVRNLGLSPQDREKFVFSMRAR